MTVRQLRCLLLLAAMAPSIAPAGDAGGKGAVRLVVTVEGLETDDGKVRIALFDGEESYLEDPVAAAVLEIEGRRARWTVEVAPGLYALAAFHDRNGNGRNDPGRLGIPSEPYGFSNGARRLFGPPSWQAASFPVRADPTRTTLRLR